MSLKVKVPDDSEKNRGQNSQVIHGVILDVLFPWERKDVGVVENDTTNTNEFSVSS